jgi:hypothetical protein
MGTASRCRDAMGIAVSVGAHWPPQQPPRCLRARALRPTYLPGVTLLQAAFRTSTGSIRSASRYSTRNGESVRPSPGLPRGGQDRLHGASGDKAFTLRRLARAGSPAVSRSLAPGSPGPPRSERSNPALGCSSTTPENVYGAVGPPLLYGQRGLVPKARALSHYSGDPSGKRSITRT